MGSISSERYKVYRGNRITERYTVKQDMCIVSGRQGECQDMCIVSGTRKECQDMCIVS